MSVTADPVPNCGAAAPLGPRWRRRLKRRTRGSPETAYRNGLSGVARHLRAVSATRESLSKLGGEWTALSLVLLTAAVVSLIDLVPPTDYGAPTLRAALDSAISVCVFASTWLLRARFVYSRRLRDIVLLGTLLLLGAISLLVGAIPAALNHGVGGEVPVVALWGELFVAAGFVAAASAPGDRLLVGGRPVVIVATVSVIALLASQVGGMLLGSHFAAARPHTASGSSGAGQHPVELMIGLATSGLFTWGAVGFALMDRIERDGSGKWFAAAGMLLAAASFSRLGLPFERAQPVASDEIVRLFASVLLLAAAIHLELGARQGVARAAALAERRRVAHDLHDGLAQDLAFIAAHGARIAQELGQEHPVAIAARRALVAARYTIAELSQPASANAQEALEAVAYELSARFAMQIAVHAELDREMMPDAREQLARIAREAITNAARHGSARNVVVTLARTERGLVLRVIDDGTGINKSRSRTASEGFGLRSMRERAGSLGGQLVVRQGRKRGTELEVVLP